LANEEHVPPVHAFPCPHVACPKGYKEKGGLLWHLQTSLHCQRERCTGCDTADVLIQEKRRWLEVQQEAQQELDQKQPSLKESMNFTRRLQRPAITVSMFKHTLDEPPKRKMELHRKCLSCLGEV